MYERMAPEDPTNAPVIIKAVFSKVKPIPAAAQPNKSLALIQQLAYQHHQLVLLLKNQLK